MSESTRKFLIEVASTVGAIALELWRKVSKREEKKGGKSNGGKC